MKKDKLKVYTLELLILIVLSFTLFVSNTHNKTLLAIFLLIATTITIILLKKRKVESINTKKVTIFLVIFAVIYLVVFYLMGLRFGYYKATITFSMFSLMHQIIPLMLIIILSEIMRNIFIVQNTKYTKILTFIIMVLVDLTLYANIYEINTFENFIEIIGFILFSSIACNLLYNYISAKYGIIGIIIYRFITNLYMYIIPIIPNVHIFFRAILRMIYPYIIYQVIKYTFTENKHIISLEDKKKNITSKIILSILIVAFAMLISCQFKYGILVVASGSMSGTINKGDAIVFEKFNNQEEIKEGQIIIFLKDDAKIVHRVIEVKKVNGERRYITKGDINEQNDEGYITDENIYGVCKFKVSYIGYPSIWIRDIFSNN